MEWLAANRGATPTQFLEKLQEIYSWKALQKRFPGYLPPGVPKMEFFVLRPYDDFLYGYRYAFGSVEEPTQIVDPDPALGTCPACGHTLSTRIWLPPHRISLSSSSYPDVLYGAGLSFFFSGRLLEAWKVEGLTEPPLVFPAATIVRVGSAPAERVRKRPPTYHYVKVRLGGAFLDEAASGARRDNPVKCAYCRPNIDALKKVVFEEGSWTGQDIFGAFGLPGHEVITERVLRLFEKYEFTGVDIVAAEDYHFDRKIPRGEHKPRNRRRYRQVYPRE